MDGLVNEGIIFHFSAYNMLCACPSVRHTDASVKTVEVRIMQFSPYISSIPQFLRDTFYSEILTGFPEWCH